MVHRTTGRGVAQAFARREAATNSNGQLFTNGRTIWSYGFHWPLAHWGPDGKLYMNEDRYSVTTSKHRSFVISGLVNTGVHISANLHADGRGWYGIHDLSCSAMKRLVADEAAFLRACGVED